MRWFRPVWRRHQKDGDWRDKRHPAVPKGQQTSRAAFWYRDYERGSSDGVSLRREAPALRPHLDAMAVPKVVFEAIPQP